MARAGEVDMKGIGTQVSKTPAFKNAARDEVKGQVARAKQQLELEFAAHPVTQEIEAGPSSENTSNTLGGVGADGNLSTFIGFEVGSMPTSIVKQAIKENVHTGLVTTRPTNAGQSCEAQVKVSYPTAKDLRPYTLLPWEPGKSWLEGMEDGITGFSEYLSKKFEKGRSRFGLQSKNRIRKSSFRPVSYFSQLINNFIRRITGKNK